MRGRRERLSVLDFDDRAGAAVRVHEIDQLRLGFGDLDLVRHLEGYGHDAAGIVGQRRRREQDEVRAPLEAADDLDRGLLPREFAEIFLDVLNLERTLFEVVLCDSIFHGSETGIVYQSASAPGPRNSPSRKASTKSPKSATNYGWATVTV